MFSAAQPELSWGKKTKQRVPKLEKKKLIELVTGIQENVSKVSIVSLYCNIRKCL
jgi:hypothetical protein